MTQTYPSPITRAMVKKIDDGVARPVPAVGNPGIATANVAYAPNTLAAKAAASVPAGTFATLNAVASNMPY